MLGFKHFRRFSRVNRVVPGTNLVTVPFGIAGAALVMPAVTLVLDGMLGDRPIVVLPYWLTVGSLDEDEIGFNGEHGFEVLPAIGLATSDRAVQSRLARLGAVSDPKRHRFSAEVGASHDV
jgi:hypothetical protein